MRWTSSRRTKRYALAAVLLIVAVLVHTQLIVPISRAQALGACVAKSQRYRLRWPHVGHWRLLLVLPDGSGLPQGRISGTWCVYDSGSRMVSSRSFSTGLDNAEDTLKAWGVPGPTLLLDSSAAVRLEQLLVPGEDYELEVLLEQPAPPGSMLWLRWSVPYFRTLLHGDDSLRAMQVRHANPSTGPEPKAATAPQDK